MTIIGNCHCYYRDFMNIINNDDDYKKNNYNNVNDIVGNCPLY